MEKKLEKYSKIKTYDDYNLILKSGMFFETFPDLTGDWNQDREIILDTYLESIDGLILSYTNRSKEVKSCKGFSIKEGWYVLIQELIEELLKIGWDRKILQVKEKFGGLRFYITNDSKEFNELIAKYERKSYEVCEKCGRSGEVRRGKWIRVLCDECYKIN